MSLSLRQTKFVAEYLKCQNASKAAIAAGYSPKSAKCLGSRMLKHPEVATALSTSNRNIVTRVDKVHRLKRELVDNAEVSQVRVLQEVAKMANFDSPEISPEQRFKYKLPANELLARHLGIVQTSTSTSTNVGVNIVIQMTPD